MAARQVLVAGVLSALLLPQPADAHDFVVDQEAITFGNTTSIRYNECGQEFVPQQSTLDVLELMLSLAGGVMAEEATIEVRIRFQSPTGPIIASSVLAMTAPSPQSIHHFDFPSLPLVPGQVYFIEPVYLSGPGNPCFHGGAGVYAPGRMWTNGLSSDGEDIWFREGLSPSTAVPSTTWGRVKAAYR